MSAQPVEQLKSCYRLIIDDVLSRVRADFVNAGSEDVLDELRVLWEHKLAETGVISEQPPGALQAPVDFRQLGLPSYMVPQGRGAPRQQTLVSAGATLSQLPPGHKLTPAQMQILLQRQAQQDQAQHPQQQQRQQQQRVQSHQHQHQQQTQQQPPGLQQLAPLQLPRGGLVLPQLPTSGQMGQPRGSLQLPSLSGFPQLGQPQGSLEFPSLSQAQPAYQHQQAHAPLVITSSQLDAPRQPQQHAGQPLVLGSTQLTARSQAQQQADQPLVLTSSRLAAPQQQQQHPASGPLVLPSLQLPLSAQGAAAPLVLSSTAAAALGPGMGAPAMLGQAKLSSAGAAAPQQQGLQGVQLNARKRGPEGLGQGAEPAKRLHTEVKLQPLQLPMSIPQTDGPADPPEPSASGKAAKGKAGGKGKDKAAEKAEDVDKKELAGEGDAESEDNLSDVELEDDETGGLDNVLLGQFEQVKRIKNKWKLVMKSCIMHVDGRDTLIHKVNGDLTF